jgi:hypothetical protein
MEEQRQAQDWLRVNWLDHEQSLNKVNSMLQSDPDNASLLEWKETLTKMLEWLREDSLKRMIRDARMGPTTSHRRIEAKVLSRCQIQHATNLLAH